MHYVIVGAGPTGVTAAENLRQVDPDGSVTLIGGEKEPPYGRMAIPYYLIGKVGEEGTYLRKGDDHYGKAGIDYVQGTVEKVSPDDKSVMLAGGQSIAYDKLLVASGSHPVKPPVAGLEGPRVHHCWTLEDARAIAGITGEGVDVVFAYPGGASMELHQSLTKSEKIRTILPRQEQGGGFMAHGYARATGKAGVCMATSGFAMPHHSHGVSFCQEAGLPEGFPATLRYVAREQKLEARIDNVRLHLQLRQEGLLERVFDNDHDRLVAIHVFGRSGRLKSDLLGQALIDPPWEVQVGDDLAIEGTRIRIGNLRIHDLSIGHGDQVVIWRHNAR